MDPESQQPFHPLDRITYKEAEEVWIAVSEILEPSLAKFAQEMELDAAAIVVFQQVGRACARAREQKEVDLKSAARTLHMHVSQLKHIELGAVYLVRPSALDRYVKWLGLDDWYRNWQKRNPEVRVGRLARPSWDTRGPGFRRITGGSRECPPVSNHAPGN